MGRLRLCICILCALQRNLNPFFGLSEKKDDSVSGPCLHVQNKCANKLNDLFDLSRGVKKYIIQT